MNRIILMILLLGVMLIGCSSYKTSDNTIENVSNSVSNNASDNISDNVSDTFYGLEQENGINSDSSTVYSDKEKDKEKNEDE